MREMRRSAVGRPSGTDGSDFSYRMVVESRYTKVAKYKARLSSLLLIQGLVVLAGALLILVPVSRGEDPNVLALSSVVLDFLSLIIGESGRRRSRSGLLKTYLILSVFAVLLSVFCSIKSNILMEVFQNGVSNSWDKQREQLIGAVQVLTELGALIFAGSTTLSLIYNMSPPKSS